jgi:small basic protein
MPDAGEKRVVISAEKARQGEIVLRKRWQRGVFIAGLVGAVVLAIVLRFAASWMGFGG